MKIRLSLFALLCSLVIVPVQAQEKKGSKESETELELVMDKMGAEFRQLRRNASKPDMNANSLERIAKLRSYAQESAKLEPMMKKDLPAGEQAQFVEKYRSEMKHFIALIDKVEAAFKAGKNEEAAALLKDMGEAQKAGHKQFKKKKD